MALRSFLHAFVATTAPVAAGSALADYPARPAKLSNPATRTTLASSGMEGNTLDRRSFGTRTANGWTSWETTLKNSGLLTTTP